MTQHVPRRCAYNHKVQKDKVKMIRSNSPSLPRFYGFQVLTIKQPLFDLLKFAFKNHIKLFIRSPPHSAEQTEKPHPAHVEEITCLIRTVGTCKCHQPTLTTWEASTPPDAAAGTPLYPGFSASLFGTVTALESNQEGCCKPDERRHDKQV